MDVNTLIAKGLQPPLTPGRADEIEMPTAETEHYAKQFSKALGALDLNSKDVDQFHTLRDNLGALLDIAPAEILIAAVPGSPMVLPLLNDRLNSHCRLLILVVTTPAELQQASRSVSGFIGATRKVDVAAMCTFSSYGDWYIPTVICRNGDGLGARIKDVLSPAASIVAPASSPQAATRGPAGCSTSTIIMDDRIRRMTRLAVASSSAVILVGPPGTGKTTIIKEILQEISYNPAAFGLSHVPKEPKWVTPCEAWTSTDLVGGETSDESGRRGFRLGHVLEAIRQDRWLILDEANRANMDRIFGGLLTWLSDQRVELGRASTDLNSPSVVLDWNDKPQCEAQRVDLLDGDRIMSNEPIRFLAGSDWRLMGTYNAQDAHKVFTFGQALGRRFARVPIPVIEPSQFQQALKPLVKDLPEHIAKVILGIFTAHRRSTKARLGPAVFLKIASYVGAGLKLPQLAHAAMASRPGMPASDDVLLQLVSEAYISSAGTWLAELEPPDLEQLGKAIIASGLPECEWNWMKEHLPTLAS